jgi:hypothetical protein
MAKLTYTSEVLESIPFEHEGESNTKAIQIPEKTKTKETEIVNAPLEKDDEKHGTVSQLPTPSSVDASTSMEQIRKLNRQVTKNIPVKVKKMLVEERNYLVNKKFKEGLTDKEERRLIYIRWQLDRIDDAEYGETLDLYESIADQYDIFAHDIKELLIQIKGVK